MQCVLLMAGCSAVRVLICEGKNPKDAPIASSRYQGEESALNARACVV
ncbi:MAG: hypothetical protein ACI8RD_007546 [Bacillariaceae sp.]|jgi:hypothetical protein